MARLIEIIGFSQSYEWYTGCSLVDLADKDKQVVLNGAAVPENWGGRFTFGASIEKWKDQPFAGWRGTYCSERLIKEGQGKVVVFNISGESRTKEEWTRDIADVAKIIRSKYAEVMRIYFQPVVGTQVVDPKYRASRNHPVICDAISAAVRQLGPPFAVGFIPKLRDSQGYSDPIGHLSPEGAAMIYAQAVDYYEDQLAR